MKFSILTIHDFHLNSIALRCRSLSFLGYLSSQRIVNIVHYSITFVYNVFVRIWIEQRSKLICIAIGCRRAER